MWPHVSLMNYTYLPSAPHALPNCPTPGAVIILTVQPSTKKTHNLLENPRVSLLVHDWVSHRASLPSAEPAQSALATLLTNLNSASLSSISATLFGNAHVLAPGTPEEEYYRRVHTDNCVGAGESLCYLEGADSRIVVVTVNWTRVADHKGLVSDWVAPGQGEAFREFEAGAAARPLLNGGDVQA